jgi:hypothetical protein
MLGLLAAEHVHDAGGSLVGILRRNQRARHRALLRTHNHLPLFASVDDNLSRAALGGVGHGSVPGTTSRRGVGILKHGPEAVDALQHFQMRTTVR